MLFLDNETVERVLSMRECIDAQDEAFRGLATGDSVHRPRIDMYVPCDLQDGYWRWGTMEGASKSLGVFAIRMKSDILTWPSHEDGTWTEEKHCVQPGLYCGLVMLFSTRNGEPLAMMNDGVIQHMRVGGGAGLGAKYLAREDAHTVGMLGSGGMARAYLQAFCAVRDIRRVKVYSPTRANREAYASEMGERLGIHVEAVDDPQTAVRGVDIAAACTDSMLPVLHGAWLEPGMHVTDVRGEVDAEVYRRANVIFRQGTAGISAPAAAREGLGREPRPHAYMAGTDEDLKRIPAAPLQSGRREREKHPTFTDLVSGKVPGRTSPSDITAYLNVGNQGLQFAAVGAVVYRKAKESGLGRELPTEWFLQTIRD